MRRSGWRILALTLALVAIGTSAKADDPAEDKAEDLYFAKGAREERPPAAPALGYGMYAASFYDLSYTFESSAWAHSGHGKVSLSGISYTENKGLLSNILMMIFAMGGGPSATHVRRGGEVVSDPTAAGQFRDAYVQQIAEGGSTLPFSLGLRLYHDSLGSDMNGFALELGVPRMMNSYRGMWQLSLNAGQLQSNRRSTPAGLGVPPEPSFGRSWFGAALLIRHELIGPWLGVVGSGTVAISTPTLVLLEAGPELMLGNRVALRALTTADVKGGGGVGLRAEAGVRF
jgi:hypothetical protein